MTTYVLADGSEWETRCILDGTYGWHNTYRIIDLAAEVSREAGNGKGDGGYVLDADDRRDLDGYKMGVRAMYIDHVGEMAEEAETYLNSLVPENVPAHFEWCDGDFLFIEDSETDDNL